MSVTPRLCAIVALGWSITSGCAAETSKEPIKEAPKTIEESDAGVKSEPLPSAITIAPAAGTHLDGDATGYRPRGYQPRQTKGKTIELVLRSTPPGATAAIDGRAIGVTPTFWSGKADHQAHDFTFVKAGHTMARYRFVATHSGVVHGSLSPIQRAEETGNEPKDPAPTPP